MRNFKPQTRAPKGALCACGDNLGPHFLAADGGSVPESRAPWAPEPAFSAAGEPSWADMLRLIREKAPGYLAEQRDKALRYMAERAAPYYGGQRGVNGGANLREHLDQAAGMLRGATAATAGMPGDLNSLARGVGAASQGPLAAIAAMERETPFPRTEQLKKGERGFLPAGGASPAFRAGDTLGEFMPLVPPSAVGASARAVRRHRRRAARRWCRSIAARRRRAGRRRAPPSWSTWACASPIRRGPRRSRGSATRAP